MADAISAPSHFLALGIPTVTKQENKNRVRM